MAPKTWNPGDVLTASDLNQFGEGWWGTYSDTTSGAHITVTHGAPFTPMIVICQPVTPATGSNRGYPYVTAITATTFTLGYESVIGSMSTVAVTGYFLCFP